MKRNGLCAPAVLILLCAGQIVVAENIVLFEDDFEEGYGAWTPRVFPTINNDTPTLFNSSGSGIYGPNTNYPASNTVGFASNIQKDNTSGAWVQRQFPNAVPPGTYDVTVEVDVYVYRPQTGDRWSVGNGVYVLTNSLYDNPLWWWDPGVPNFQGVGNRFWPGIGLGGQGNSWAYNGVWRRETITGQINTTTGNIELRLLMHDKNSGEQAVAWDNLELTIGNAENPELFTFSEDWEAADALDAWTVKAFLPYFDTPLIFNSGDSLLYANVDNPGSKSVGYSSDLPSDKVEAAWLEKQFLNVVSPGTHVMRLEFDWYVYKNQSQRSDPWGVGNRIYLLTDDHVGALTWSWDQGDPSPGFSVVRWPGRVNNDTDTDWVNNGVWLHEVIEREVTTTTGSFELRLLLHNKWAGQQAVAWDNVRLSVITPCSSVRFDMDADGDVDQEDFGIFQSCFTGDNGEMAFECRCLNSDGDTDIDATDLAAFNACAAASGPTIAADVECDDHLVNP